MTIRTAVGALAAMLVLEIFEAKVERRVLGRWPVYSARAIVRRWLPRRVWRRGRTPVLARTLRSAYVIGLALAARHARSWLPRSTARAAAVYGMTIAATELLVLPKVRAVPALSRWGRAELALFLAHVAVFAVVMTEALDARRPRRGRRPVRFRWKVGRHSGVRCADGPEP